FPPGRSGRGRQEPRRRSLPHALTARSDGGGAPIVAPGCQRTLGRGPALGSGRGANHYKGPPRPPRYENPPQPPVLARAAAGRGGGRPGGVVAPGRGFLTPAEVS